MNISPLIAQALLSLWPLLLLVALAALLGTAWFKGLLGEFLVNTLARLLLDQSKYRLIKNVTLPTEDGTTQIDHIIVSIYGVFVVETKNLKGWIYGGRDQKNWTQKIYQHRNTFQNPLHQNFKHVKTLQTLLGLRNDQIHSLVVFVGDSTFKTEMPENVTYGRGYIRYIKSKTTPVLSREEADTLIAKIESGRLTPTLKTHREHVAHVRAIVAEKEQAILCPRCGGQMIRREVKGGPNAGLSFWGCAAFPKCRGTTPIQ